MIINDDEDDGYNGDDFNGEIMTMDSGIFLLTGSTFGLVTWDYC
jgi:hypothetical protein